MKKITIKFKDILIVIISLGVVVGPIVTDQNNLPKGWELPKVYFWQVFGLLLITIILIHKAFSIYRDKDFNINYKSLTLYLTLILIIFLSVLHSTDVRTLSISSTGSPIHRIILDTFTSNSSEKVKLATFGNVWREQGAITYIILISALWLIKDYFSKQNIFLLLTAFVFSGLIQSIWGISQFLDLYQNDPERWKTGYWVYGTFGQSNFYSGHLLIGFFSLLILYLSNLTFHPLHAWRGKFYKFQIPNSSINFVYLILNLLFLFAIAVSLSYWAYAVAFVGVVFFLYSHFEYDYKRFIKIFIPATVILIAVIFPTLKLFASQNASYKFRLDIWKGISQVYVEYPLSANASGERRLDFILGSGFDTLGEKLYSVNILTPLYVDRAHNFFLDVFTSLGALGLILFLILCSYPIYRIKYIDGNKNKVEIMIIILMWLWLFRSFIHETSIENIVEFMIILSACYGLLNKTYDKK